MFAKSDVVPEWVPDFTATWALDRSVTTLETAARHRRRLHGKLAKIGEEWSLNDGSANAGHDMATAKAQKALSAETAVALHAVQQEAERLLCKRHTTAG